MSNYMFRHFCQTYKAYQSFSSVEAMKESMRLFRSAKGFLLSPSCLEILKYLERMSTHVVGVSWMNFDTIANEINVSLKTVQRCVNTLMEEGILEREHRKDRKGGRRSLLILKPFQPEQPDSEHFFVEAVQLDDQLNVQLLEGEKEPSNPSVATVSVDQNDVHKKVINLSLNVEEQRKKNNVKETATSQFQSLTSNLIDKFLTRTIPDYFKDAIRMQVNPKMLRTLWDKTVMCHRECNVKPKIVLTDIVEDAWQTAFKLMKQKKMEKQGNFEDNLIGFYYGILRRMLKDFALELSVNNYDDYCDYFWESKGKKVSNNIFKDYTPFLTKHKRKLAAVLQRSLGCSWDEAVQRACLNL